MAGSEPLPSYGILTSSRRIAPQGAEPLQTPFGIHPLFRPRCALSAAAVLTVGGYTEEAVLDATAHPGWRPGRPRAAAGEASDRFPP